jgi:leucine-rich repeat protein SHOC2
MRSPQIFEARRRIQQAWQMNASTLSLSWLALKEVPQELGRLTNLKTLSLKQNQLTSLPKELGQLKNLRELDVSQNELNFLPKRPLQE